MPQSYKGIFLLILAGLIPGIVVGAAGQIVVERWLESTKAPGPTVGEAFSWTAEGPSNPLIEPPVPITVHELRLRNETSEGEPRGPVTTEFRHRDLHFLAFHAHSKATRRASAPNAAC